MTEDEMVRWHHGLNGHEFDYTLGVGDGQGDLLCWSPWCRKESDMTEQLNCHIYLYFKVHFFYTQVIVSVYIRRISNIFKRVFASNDIIMCFFIFQSFDAVYDSNSFSHDP